jgi:hypothetical protein
MAPATVRGPQRRLTCSTTSNRSTTEDGKHSTLGYASPMKFLEAWISTQHEQTIGGIMPMGWKTKNRGNLSLERLAWCLKDVYGQYIHERS